MVNGISANHRDMDFEEMKKELDAMEVKLYSRGELMNMLHQSHVPRFKKLKRRLTLELLYTVMLAVAGAAISPLFTGPALLTLAISGIVIVLVFNRFLQYFFLERSKEKNLHLLMVDFGKPLKKALYASRIVNVVVCTILLLIQLNRTRDGVGMHEWPFLIPILFALMAVATRWWLRRLVATEKLFDN